MKKSGTVCDECFRQAKLKDGTQVAFRPLVREDKERWLELVNSFSPQTAYFRFLAPVGVMTEEAFERYVDVDFVHAIAIVAAAKDTDGKERIIAVARYYADEKNPSRAEFAIVVQDSWQKKGVGTELMRHLCKVAKGRGVKLFYALVFKENKGMLTLLDKIGAKWDQRKFDADTVRVEFLV